MFCTFLLLIIAVSVTAKVFTENVGEQRELFSAFKARFSKIYSDKHEEEHRFLTFVKNLKEADKREAEDRARGGTATHGVTKFSDLTKEEFKAFLGSKKPAGHRSKAFTAAKPIKRDGDAGLVDWTGIYTTPVKNQGQCGSCWAFSATEQIESDAMRTLGVDYVLAPEQIADCAAAAYGCGGGWTEVAYGYVMKAGGIEQESDYPYTSGTPPNRHLECTADSADNVVSVNKFYKIDGEDAMGDFMESTGPLSVCVDAETWSSYTGGIMSVCGQSVDHCVQAVGVDRSGSSPYWKVRNSWGPEWGEQGSILLAYGQDTCAISSDPTYTSVSLTQ